MSFSWYYSVLCPKGEWSPPCRVHEGHNRASTSATSAHCTLNYWGPFKSVDPDIPSFSSFFFFFYLLSIDHFAWTSRYGLNRCAPKLFVQPSRVYPHSRVLSLLACLSRQFSANRAKNRAIANGPASFNDSTWPPEDFPSQRPPRFVHLPVIAVFRLSCSVISFENLERIHRSPFFDCFDLSRRQLVARTVTSDRTVHNNSPLCLSFWTRRLDRNDQEAINSSFAFARVTFQWRKCFNLRIFSYSNSILLYSFVERSMNSSFEISKRLSRRNTRLRSDDNWSSLTDKQRQRDK